MQETLAPIDWGQPWLAPWRGLGEPAWQQVRLERAQGLMGPVQDLFGYFSQ